MGIRERDRDGRRGRSVRAVVALVVAGIGSIAGTPVVAHAAATFDVDATVNPSATVYRTDCDASNPAPRKIAILRSVPPATATVQTGDVIDLTFDFSPPVVLSHTGTAADLGMWIDPTTFAMGGAVTYGTVTFDLVGSNVPSSISVPSTTTQSGIYLAVTPLYRGPVSGLLVDPASDGTISSLHTTFTVPGSVPPYPAVMSGLVEANMAISVAGDCSGTTQLLYPSCSPGYWANGGTCVPASPGYYVPMAGATQQFPCSPGYFQAFSAGITCNAAPAGSYVATTAAVAATLCPLGTYQPYDGMTICVVAEPGTFVPTTGSVATTPCPIGTFSNVAGAVACQNAPAGSYVDTTGATEATPCPIGTYSNVSGSIFCQQAPAGTYVDTTGATEATPCPVGYFSGTAGSASCQAAPIGTYVDTTGATAATPCPAGQTTATVASTSAAACTSTWRLSGFYRPVDMGGALNVVKSGSVVPLKFEVFSGDTELTSISVVQSLTWVKVSCSALTETSAQEHFTGGFAVLRYDRRGGQFIANWFTPWHRDPTCYRVTMTTDDGSSLVAFFKLR